jgi:hypothetical protein
MKWRISMDEDAEKNDEDAEEDGGSENVDIVDSNWAPSLLTSAMMSSSAGRHGGFSYDGIWSETSVAVMSRGGKC